jgi:membrane fusion protein (multidrug efflux system)
MNQSVTDLKKDMTIPSVVKKNRRPFQVAIAAALVLAVGGGYLFFQRDSVSTDNAYIDGPIVTISSQVSGPVAIMAVQDNQHVNKGDLLLQIDPRPFQIALDKAQANLALTRQGVHQSSAGVQAAEADVLQNRSALTQAASDAARAHQLAPKGFLSKEDIEKSDTLVRTTTAALQSSEAKLAESRAQLGYSGDDNANVKTAQAAVEAAKLQLDYSRISAPFSGSISNLNLQPGSMVQTGAPLFALIGNSSVWVNANFKETQFKKLHPGLKAEIRVDMYPHKIFHGTVESISGGSGTAFSLLPPQNATGNWVKVTQRVPVKIIINDADIKMPLRISTSANVTIFLD